VEGALENRVEHNLPSLEFATKPRRTGRCHDSGAYACGRMRQPANWGE
jgi:hypothetical protein